MSIVTITRSALLHSAPASRRELLFDLASNEGIRVYPREASDKVTPPEDTTLMPLVPAFGVLASLFLMFQLDWETWARFGVWLLIGLVIYFGYGRRHSLMNPNSKRHGQVSGRS